MKTFYTLLLAFGLCLTSHAQSNINVVNYQNANLQSQNEINSLLSTNQNRLLLQNGFSAKQLSNDNLGLKLIKVVNSNSIDNAVLTNFAGDYSNVEIIVLSNIDANSQVITNLDLNGFSSLKYIIINTNETLINTFVQNMLQNVQLPPNVLVVYKHEVLM